MIETVAILNEKVQIELSKKPKLISLICVIIGAIGLVAYIAISMFIDHWAINILLFFAFPFGVGLVTLTTINKNTKNFKLNNVINNYKFYEDHIIITSFKGDEQIGMSKIEYSAINKIKETETFLFFFANFSAAFPIIKTALNNDELSTIKTLLTKNKKTKLNNKQ